MPYLGLFSVISKLFPNSVLSQLHSIMIFPEMFLNWARALHIHLFHESMEETERGREKKNKYLSLLTSHVYHFH